MTSKMITRSQMLMIPVALALALGGCSLIVQNKLEGEEADGGSGRDQGTTLEDGQVPTDGGLDRDTAGWDGQITPGDMLFPPPVDMQPPPDAMEPRPDVTPPPPLLQVHGENGNFGPFTIGERIVIQASMSAGSPTEVRIGPDANRTMVCPGEWVSPDQYTCTIPPLTPEGENRVFFGHSGQMYQPDPMFILLVRRLLVVGGGGVERIILVATREPMPGGEMMQVGEILLPGPMSSQAGPPILSPSGRYLLLAYDGAIVKNKNVLVDLVTRQAWDNLPEPRASLELSTFEPEYQVHESWLGGVPVYRPERALFQQGPSPKNEVHRLRLPEVPPPSSPTFPKSTFGLYDLQHPVVWLPQLNGQKWMAAYAAPGEGALPVLCAHLPDPQNPDVVDCNPFPNLAPEGVEVAMTYAAGRNPNQSPPISREMALVAVGTTQNWETIASVFYLENNQLVMSQVPQVFSLQVSSGLQLSSVPGTSVVAPSYYGFASSGIPSGRLEDLGVYPDRFELLLEEANGYPLHSAEDELRVLPTTYASERLMVVRHDQVGIVEAGGYLIAGPSTTPLTRSVVHHPLEQQVYRLIADVSLPQSTLSREDYDANGFVSTKDIPLPPGMEGLLIQP